MSRASHDRVRRALRAFGLGYPEAHTKSPWPSHLDLAVRDKTFAYLNVDGEPLSISCKLPHSAPVALMLPGTKPTAYGLGRSGWVTADFSTDQDPPLEVLKGWIDESYRAQAPKRLVAALGAVAPAPERTPAPSRKPRPSGAARRPAKAAAKRGSKKTAKKPARKVRKGAPSRAGGTRARRR